MIPRDGGGGPPSFLARRTALITIIDAPDPHPLGALFRQTIGQLPERDPDGEMRTLLDQLEGEADHRARERAMVGPATEGDAGR